MRRKTSPPEVAPESALARLLELESRLEAMLESARLQAETVVAEAGQRAAARASTLAVELAAAETELSAALAAEAEVRVGQERALLAAARGRYEAVDTAGLEALSAWVVEQVLQMAGEESS
jgi:hypothetical protein